MNRQRIGVKALAVALALVAADCGAQRVASAAIAVLGTAPRPAGMIAPSASKIQHVVFLIQENRSFNNLFLGYPGALTQNYGYDSKGHKVTLHPQVLGTSWDIDHSATAFFVDCDGSGTIPGTMCRLDGWDKESACCGSIPKDFAYAYVPRKQVKPYWTLAKQYVLADNVLQSNLDGSFVAHEFSIAGYARHAVDYPASYWGCPGGKTDTVPTLNPDRTYGPAIRACFDFKTLGDEADAAGVSWRYYAGTPSGDGGLWSAYQSIKHIYTGTDWTSDVISPPAQFLTDIGNGTLANITWITPTFANSDHPGYAAATGPQWVASVVNAIGQSPFWSSTAIFVLWDDWGGWFDPVAPQYIDYDGLGFRIPLMIVSPYAKKGYVSHVRYETTSVLKFMENAFRLHHLAPSDARAADPALDAFDFAKPPRPFKPIAGALPRGFWLEQPQTVPQRLVPGD